MPGAIGGLIASVLALAIAGCAGGSTGNGDYVDLPGLGPTRVDVPRPTTVEGQGCTVEIPSGESVAERALALRAIGLFGDRAALSDADLGAEIEAQVAQQWGGVPPDDFIMELLVAEHDVERVWWRDLEADVVEENQVYAATLAEWADISVGAFTPSSIVEDWQSETDPSVTFALGGSDRVLEPEYLEDWIDPRIATPINEMIAPSGRQFAFFKAFDQTAFLMAVTAEERDAFESRGWCFE
jgi:hypothetical protein